MFSQGSLLYINDFEFAHTNVAYNPLTPFRNKYLLVLDQKGENDSLFCCFTTTLKKYPLLHQSSKPGCNQSLLPFNVFQFVVDEIVTDLNFSFRELTYVAGNKGQVFTHDLPSMYTKYRMEDKIQYKGKLTPSLIFEIIRCLHKSPTLEGDIKEELFEIGDDIYSKIESNISRE